MGNRLRTFAGISRPLHPAHVRYPVRMKIDIGQTPCTNAIGCTGDGFINPPAKVIVFSKFVPSVVIFTAELNGRTNSQVLHGPAFWKTPDRVPAAMFFDLAKP